MRFTVAAVCELPVDRTLPSADPGRVGGLSGLVLYSASGTWLAVSDDQSLPRWYRLDLRVSGNTCEPRVIGPAVAVAAGPTPARVRDLEGIALLASGDVLVSMEGSPEGPAGPFPGLVEVGPDGRWRRALPLPERYRGGEGRAGRGLRDNAAFESLTVTPSGRVFTAIEAPLVEDDEAPTFARGAVSRLLEFEADSDGAWAVRHEYALPLAPIAHPGDLDPQRADSGAVDLLALDDRTLLMLERAYTRGTTGGRNDILLSRLILDHAEDVSRRESLRHFTGVPVRKQPLLDLGSLAGALPAWLRTLDNFEGLAHGPRLADGRPSIVLVSDDNFSAGQRTVFIVLAVDQR